MPFKGDIMAVASSRNFAGALIGMAALAAGTGAQAQDSVAGAIFGAGTGAIIGHVLGGPDAAVAGGLVGAVTGAALASAGNRSAVQVHYDGGYGGRYAPPRYDPRHSRGPVYVMPPPAVVFVPNRGHGYWHHGVDAWGRPLRSWIPAPAPHRYYSPPPRRHYGYRDDYRRGGW